MHRIVVELLEQAPESTAAQLRALAKRRRTGLLRATEEARHRSALADRRVWVEPLEDGMAQLTAVLDAVVATAIADRLDTLAARTRSRDCAATGRNPDPVLFPGTGHGTGGTGGRGEVGARGASGPGRPGTGVQDPAVEADRRAGTGAGTAEGTEDMTAGEDRRTLSQRRADVFTDLMLDGEITDWPAHLRGARGQVTVTVPALALAEAAGVPVSDLAAGWVRESRCAELAGHGPVPMSLAARIAAAAPSWARVLTDPVTGTVTDYDRTTYSVPADLRRQLQIRDGTCRFPGCRRRAARCDIDHTVAWEHGGTTAVGNLAHLCRHHHLLKHRDGPAGRWRVLHVDPQQQDGVLDWMSPAGRVHRTYPQEHHRSGAHPGLLQDPPPF